MNMLLYEHLCALEPHLANDDPLRALLPEGRAMLDAVTADFRAVPGVTLVNFNTPHHKGGGGCILFSC
jgi:predicted ATP-grasp superfamily ATP-dependent carboligase